MPDATDTTQIHKEVTLNDTHGAPPLVVFYRMINANERHPSDTLCVLFYTRLCTEPVFLVLAFLLTRGALLNRLS